MKAELRLGPGSLAQIHDVLHILMSPRCEAWEVWGGLGPGGSLGRGSHRRRGGQVWEEGKAGRNGRGGRSWCCGRAPGTPIAVLTYTAALQGSAACSPVTHGEAGPGETEAGFLCFGTADARRFFIMGAASVLWDLWRHPGPLPSSTSTPSCDNQKCLQTLPSVPCGAKSPPVESCLSKVTG